MRLTHVSYNSKLTLRVPLVYHDPSVESANYEQAVLLQKDYPDYGFVLKLVILSWLDLLKKFTSVTAILSNKTCSVSHEELSAFVAKFTSSNIGIISCLVKSSENFF